MRTIFRRRDSAAPPALDIYDIAYLAGGSRRVTRTALIQLRERGAIKFIGSRLRALRAGEPADHPVERALIEKCYPVGRDACSVVAEVRYGPEMKKVGRRLASYGLLGRSRQRLTPAGERALESARQEGALPAYVFDGLAALQDERLRAAVREATPFEDGLGASLVRMGNALEDDEYDREVDSASDSASASTSDSGSDLGSHSCGGHASCGSGGGGGGGGD